jgi:acetylglutamate kinase
LGTIVGEPGKTIVLKFGGSAFQPEALRPFAERVRAYVASHHRVVIVHGGGKEISALLDALDIKSVFIDGLRVTDDRTLKVVEMVLCGNVNKAIVRALLAAGVPAMGISGQDAAILLAKPLHVEKTGATGQPVVIEYGHVGEVEAVNRDPLESLLGSRIVPVLAPLGLSTQGHALNLNADTAAAAIAGALHADLFALLTDVPGVLVSENGTKKVAPLLTAADVARLKNDGTVTGGMIPKVDCCVAALRAGARSSLIASMEAFNNGADFGGTRIVEDAP